MRLAKKQAFIRRKAKENLTDPEGKCILWSRHAIVELVADNLTRRSVEQALCNVEIIEDYPVKNRPLPDCLALGWLEDQQPIHVVVAIDEDKDRILVVTVYLPSLEEWQDDWRTRRK